MRSAPLATPIDARIEARSIEARGELSVGELTGRGLTATRVSLDQVYEQPDCLCGASTSEGVHA